MNCRLCPNPLRTSLLRTITLSCLSLLLALPALAQNNSNTSGWTGGGDSRYGSATPAAPAGGDARYGSTTPAATSGAAPAAVTPTATPAPRVAASAGLTPVDGGNVDRAKVTKGSGALPRDHGQVWREYDIRPYTLRVANAEHPEQAIVDWILRETGYEAWHSDPLGLLSANRDTLRVYHTPQMQGIVADIVDRFVNSRAKAQAFSLRIATVRSPNWRAKALALMTPIPVQSPGMQGWILPKENAALLMAQLEARNDYREHSASNQMVLNGQGLVLSTMRPRSYVKGVVRTQNAWPGFQPEMGQLEEGASLEFSPLLGHDLATADAILKIRIHQVEKMSSVKMDIPSTVTGNQRMEVEVPQMTMANVHERFRWPADQVLLLSMGVVPPPSPAKGGSSLMNMIPGVNLPPRADGLLMVEVKGTAIPSSTPGAPVSTAMQPGAFSGRY